ncbi:LysR family transcriptional regulator ArgP [Lacisediminihabitans profunda]|uniref:LysR family transcriptional regulator ArgP n=1 Tax=Lacisediminihabitans profunda TaxID=2594790 RepID=A0A5C8ULJ2_9MICO|nr:LysR family transcriptional regulator ArgP [Lacisediminihabitans profunda]TXN28714.1 LysR family transcriptional regulator ArgP [Lacisediminihabitans profunda]
MDLHLDQLRTLSVVIDTGSFESAARALRVTPSAVSQRIKSLEQQVGRVLVQRSKPARLTDSGLVVLKLARQVQLLEHDTAAALNPAETAVTSVPLAINADSLATWLLPALAEVTGISFDLYLADQDHSAALLRAGTVMAAVTSEPDPVQGCTVSRLGWMRYRAVASPGYAARWMPHGPTVDALAVAPMLVFDRADSLQDRYLLARSGDVLAPPRHFIPASTEFVTAAALGLGWAMLPDAQSAGLLADGRLLLLDADTPIDVPLYWQQWSLDSPALESIADAVARAAAAHLF